jgi:hypothetical protein
MILKLKRLLGNLKTNSKLLKRIREHRNKVKEPEGEVPSIKFVYFQGLTLGNMYMRMSEGQYKGITILMQTNTKRDGYGYPKGKGKTFYFVDSHNEEFNKLSDLIALIDKGIVK